MTNVTKGAFDSRRTPTETSSFGVGRRENHDASAFYARFDPPVIDPDERVGRRPQREGPILGDARSMNELPTNSVALVVTSPPYFVGKEYEDEVMVAARAGNVLSEVPGSYMEYLRLLHDVLRECYRVLEPGGRMAVNVANLGRKPYRSLSADVIRILDDLGLFLRGEIIWRKAAASSGSCAWGSFRSPSNPVLRDVTERVVVASKGRFDRALSSARRRALGLPHVATTNSDEFMEATLDVWTIPAENARRVGHPAPFPVELPLRLIHLYTYENDLVLDPFLGSGTTLVAARHASRRGVGYDIDPEYVQIAEDRLREAMADTTDPRRVSVSVKGARALAQQTLEESGFTITKTAPKLGRTGVSYDFLVENRHHQRWYVDVAGGFTTVQPGLQRGAAVWETLGKAHVLHGTKTADEPRVLVITPKLPKPASLGRKAIKAVGPRCLFDLIDLSNASDLLRLQCYGTEQTDRPSQGFWTTEQIHQSFPTAR
ncbi:MAG: site-specific DNA-methyltransferase [Acidimicrobiia bacterium]|nr:site-specific DNA-methyltransferase [Acidimicrobiia bacterium]